MTKFFHYINENLEIINLIKSEEKELALKKVIELLEKDCQPFLKDWKKLGVRDFVYSGRANTRTPFMKKSIRQDRTPLNTYREIHEFADKWFKEKFGVKARSNAIFCSFDMEMIEGYGYEYFVFPIGQYKAISSKRVEDLFIEISQYIRRRREGSGYSSIFDLATRNSDLLKQYIYSFLDNSKYKDKLQFHDNEIMIVCKDVYLLEWTRYYEKELLNHFK